MTIQFKIQIRGIKRPPVWRRIVIPGDFTFYDLHNTIQAAFEWCDMHLYQFQRQPYDRGWLVKDIDEEMDDHWIHKPEDPSKTNVASFVQRMELKKFVYVYDFGDDWVHDITVESIDHDAELEHPVCLAGKGACPLEDCGGPWGYEMVKEEMDREEIHAFDLEEVNEELAGITAISNDYSEYDDEDLLSLSVGDAPAFIKLSDIIKHFQKDALVMCANHLGLGIDANLDVRKLRKEYVKAVLDDPMNVLSRLPLKDLFMLGRLQIPRKGNIVEVYENYYDTALVVYGLANPWNDEADNYYIQVPKDLWERMKPYLEAVLTDPLTQARITTEDFVAGLANLYGQVSAGVVVNELVRTGLLETKEEAQKVLADASELSLMLKLMEHPMRTNADEPISENTLYVSRYGWDLWGRPVLGEEGQQVLPGDYRLFTEDEILDASSTPESGLVNPAKEAFVNLLTEELHQTKMEAEDLCRDLWFREMRKGVDRKENAPGIFFQDYLVNDHRCPENMFQKAMAQMNDYLNNMPHWQLKGHTPKETRKFLSEETIQEDRLLNRHKRNASSGQSDLLSRMDLFDQTDWKSQIEAAMPFVAGKKIGRNEPCPCGSGKKYKNCCGKGN